MRKLSFFFCLLVLFFPSFMFASKDGLVIEEIQIAGESAYDEYVVIANFGEEKISLNGYLLSRKSKTGTTYNALFKFTEESMEPGERYIIGHESYKGNKDLTYTTSSYSITADNSVAILDPNKNIIDLVGFGDTITYEEDPLPFIYPGEIYKRVGGYDSNNNFKDFSKVIESEEIDNNIDKIMISEILPRPTEGDEWIEIFNPTNVDVNLYGLKICDVEGRVHCYSFSRTDSIAANSYKAFDRSITRITLNDSSDGAVLVKINDELVSSTDVNFEDASEDESYSVFGSDWRWTKIPTKNFQNVFESVIEIETDAPKRNKSAIKKVAISKAKIKSGTTENDGLTSETEDELEESQVKGAQAETSKANTKNQDKISKQMIGYVIICLGVLIPLCYIIWEKKSVIYGIYNKFSQRNRKPSE